MNKKNIITKNNIKKVANFLKEACDYFKNQGEGCYHFNLNEDLALYVGWSAGYDMADDDIIKAESDQEVRNRYDGTTWIQGYAVNAAVKVRNDYDCADFDFLDFPWNKVSGECWDNAVSMRPNMNTRQYRAEARWFLENFVSMVNEHNKKNTFLFGMEIKNLKF